jgi:hypothetical protein
VSTFWFATVGNTREVPEAIMTDLSRMSALPWVFAAAGAFAFSVLLVFATPEDVISPCGVLAFALSLPLFVGLAYNRPRPGASERYSRRRERLSGPNRGARLPS